MTGTTLSQTQQTIQLINISGYNKSTATQTIDIHTDSYIQQSAQYNNKIAMPADGLDAHSVRSTARPPSIPPRPSLALLGGARGAWHGRSRTDGPRD